MNKIYITINDKGQATFPRKIREEFGILKDSKLPIILTDKGIFIEKAPNISIHERLMVISRRIRAKNPNVKFTSVKDVYDSMSPEEISKEVGGLND